MTGLPEFSDPGKRFGAWPPLKLRAWLAPDKSVSSLYLYT